MFISSIANASRNIPNAGLICSQISIDACRIGEAGDFEFIFGPSMWPELLLDPTSSHLFAVSVGRNSGRGETAWTVQPWGIDLIQFLAEMRSAG